MSQQAALATAPAEADPARVSKLFPGWTPEEVAEALATSPTKVQAWRTGVIEMTQAERLTLSGLFRVRNEPAHE